MTAPSRSRSRRMRSSLLRPRRSRATSSGLSSATSAARGRLDVERFADFVLDIGEPALGAVAALFGAGRVGAGFADRFERGARGLIGRGERRSRLRPGGRRRRGGPPSAVSISPISAWRWGGKALRRLVELGCARARLRVRSTVSICAAALSLRSIPFVPFAADRLQAAIGQLGIAGDRLRFDPTSALGGTVSADGLFDLGKSGLDPRPSGGKASSARLGLRSARPHLLRRGCAAGALPALP